MIGNIICLIIGAMIGVIIVCITQVSSRCATEEERIAMNRGNDTKTFKFPEANDVYVGSVVCTENCLDIGLVGGVFNGRPTKVFSRFVKYDDNLKEYGTSDKTQWYDTGVHMTISEWKKLAYDTKDAAGFYGYWRRRLGVR